MKKSDDSTEDARPSAGSNAEGSDAESELPSGPNSLSAGERVASLPEEVEPDSKAVPSPARAVPSPARVAKKPSATETPAPDTRESLLVGMRQRRTTLHEVGQVAQRLSVLAPRAADARRDARWIVLSFVVGLTVALLVTMVFAGGTWRLVLGILGGTCAAALATFGALRGLSRLAARGGAREIPGPALLWVGGVVVAVLGGTGAFTWSLSAATAPVAERLVVPTEVVEKTAPPKTVRADANIKRGQHAPVRKGVIYVPPGFDSEDGRFDLVIHYHGNTQMIEESVARTKLNAVVLIYNYGEGSGKYSKPLRSPLAFDNLLDRTEKRVGELGLTTPRIRRIALSSWSAGYGALYRILESRSRADRIDTVLMQDSMHGSFYGAAEGRVSDLSLAPFVRFARRATKGEKLMAITHSAIETLGYPDTTASANALLEKLELERRVTDPADASPPPVELPVVLQAFPDRRRWLRVVNAVHEQGLHVYGCDGNAQGDHIAHLAQISETVLPALVKRWSRAADPGG